SFSTLPTRGVYLSINAQSATPTFTKLTIQTATGAANRTITDMVMDPGDPAKILVWVFGAATANDGGLWMSNGNPWAGTATWTQNAGFIRSGFGKFAVNRSGAPLKTTFALAQDEDATCANVTRQGSLRTSNDGFNWNPPISAASGFCGGQCFYDMVPAFDPTNAGTIFLGGSANTNTTACPSHVFTKSINGGGAFNPIDSGLHADSHVMVFAPSNPNIIYV